MLVSVIDILTLQRSQKILDTKVLGKICGVNARWGSYLPDWHPWENYRSLHGKKRSREVRFMTSVMELI